MKTEFQGNGWIIWNIQRIMSFLNRKLGQFTRNYAQTVKRAVDNKWHYALNRAVIVWHRATSIGRVSTAGI